MWIIPLNEEVQLDKKDMAHRIVSFSHHRVFDGIRFGKNKGTESDAPE